MTSRTFVVAGTAAQSLYGSCEALYKPDLGEEDLVEAACGAMAAGLDRDCLAGRDVAVHVVSSTGVRREDRRLGREAVAPAGGAPAGFSDIRTTRLFPRVEHSLPRRSPATRLGL